MSKRKLVIIDDETIVVKGITALISRFDLEAEVVGSAGNGIDGCEVIRAQAPDVVITDIQMPGMDGLTMIEQMHPEFPNTYFVVISGYRDFVYAQRAIRLDVMDYLEKPITKEKIQELLEKIDRKETRRQAETLNMQGDDLVVNALMLNDAESFVDAAQQYVAELENKCGSASAFKEECYRFLCLIQGIDAGRRRHYDESLLIPCEKIMLLETKEEAVSYVRQSVHRIASQMEADYKGANHHVISQLLQYINENYDRDIGLTELGELVNMSPTYLSLLFKEEMGTSYVKYMTDLRMTKAKKLLAEGKKVNEVSTMVGFSNYRYFCDVFKKNTGMTPSEYRNLG